MEEFHKYALFMKVSKRVCERERERKRERESWTKKDLINPKAFIPN